MEIISNRKISAGRKIVIRETAQEKGERIIEFLENKLAEATILEKRSIQKKIDAWKKKLQ